MATKGTKVPSVYKVPTKADPELKLFAESIKEAVEVAYSNVVGQDSVSRFESKFKKKKKKKKYKGKKPNKSK